MEISAIDTMWVLFGTMFIFFMHTGFALLETGFSRAVSYTHLDVYKRQLAESMQAISNIKS